MFTFYHIILAVLLLSTPLGTRGPKFFLKAPESLPSGEIASGDPRVKKALDKLGLKYNIDDDGDYKLTFGLGDERSQIVWIKSKTDEILGWEVRHIISICYASKTAPPLRSFKTS